MARWKPTQNSFGSRLRRHRLTMLVVVVIVGMAVAYANYQTPPSGSNQDMTAAKVSVGAVPAGVTGSPLTLAEIPADAPAPIALNTPAPGQTSGWATPPADSQQDRHGVVTGREALAHCLTVLQRGYDRLRSIPDYTATFLKRERVKGELRDEEVMHLKLRHEPFSVYLKWIKGEPGREALYVDGKCAGRLLLFAGGLKGRLLPPLELDPNSSMVMKRSRYPITEIGLRELVRTLIRDRHTDLQRREGVRCQMTTNQRFDGRDCDLFQIEYESPRDSMLYRKSVFYVDRESSLLVDIKNYTWPAASADIKQPASDRSTLIEHYRYSDVNLRAELTDHDFDRSNDSYQFQTAAGSRRRG